MEVLKNIQRHLTEMRNKISEMKSTLHGINSRLDTAEEKIQEVEKNSSRNYQTLSREKKKNLKIEQRTSETCDIIACSLRNI